VFQADTRLHNAISTNQPSGLFKDSIVGPSVLATLTWARSNGYGYAFYDSQGGTCWNAHRNRVLFIHWCKVPQIIYMYQVAKAVNATAFLYMDTDAAPDFGVPPGARGPMLNLDDFLNATETREGVKFENSKRHIYVSPSRGFWKSDIISSKVYDSPRGYLNAGVMLVRVNDDSWSILKRWWWDTLEVHSPMETMGSYFELRLEGDPSFFNASSFPLKNINQTGVTKGLVEVVDNRARIKITGVYNDSDLLRSHRLLCDPAKREYNYALHHVAKVQCSQIYWRDTTSGWPSDQERLQWIAKEDSRLSMDDYFPALGMEDGFERKVIYHWAKNKNIKHLLSEGWSDWFRKDLGKQNDSTWNSVTAWKLLLDTLPSFSVHRNATETLDTLGVLDRCFRQGLELDVRNC